MKTKLNSQLALRCRILIVALATFVLTAQASRAVLLDFTGASSSVYADNFTQVSTGTFFSQQSGYLQGKQNSNFKGMTLYSAPSTFSNETVTLNAAITGNLGTSPHLDLSSRVDAGVGFDATILLLANNHVRFQLYYGRNVTDYTGGTLLLDWEYDASAGGVGFYRPAQNGSGGSGATGNTITAGTTYQFVLESNASDEFRLTMNTSLGNLVATTGWQTSAGLQASIAESGAVGFGGLASNTAGNTLRFYSFEAIPEPGTVALSVGGALLLFTVMRRRSVVC